MTNAVLVYDKELPRGRYSVYQARPDFELLKVKQTHSNIVLLENACDGLEADAIIGQSQIPLAILTADCVPIVLLGEKKHALIHAGWKGLQNKILAQSLLLDIKPFYAFIGPHISNMNYEVQEEFKNNFVEYNAFSNRNDKIYFDLSYVTRRQLEQYYPKIKIEESGICTFSNELFHSYRRNKTTERNWNIFRT